MSTETKAPGRGRWTLPLLLALPYLAVLGYLVYRFGPTIIQLLNAAVKAAVVS